MCAEITRPSTNRGEVYVLFVDPTHAGHGVGRTLLRAGHEILNAAGCCSQAFLFTQATNDRARAVYTAAGYRPDGQTRTSQFRGRSVPEIRMTVDLGQGDDHRC